MTATDNVIEIPPTRLQQHPVRRRVRGELLDSLNHIERAETATEELRLHPAEHGFLRRERPARDGVHHLESAIRGLWSAYAVLLLVFGDQA
ncbi:hypothetical protein [Mycobacterium sp. 155]|uniref:hypothetical protein n=1 Tax=Mycobacterium sp. 155 TaxID=1157943 RepID=UPI000366E34F|nr:hypothetical protein [Mycobacterium sp. 155]